MMKLYFNKMMIILILLKLLKLYIILIIIDKNKYIFEIMAADNNTV